MKNTSIKNMSDFSLKTTENLPSSILTPSCNTHIVTDDKELNQFLSDFERAEMCFEFSEFIPLCLKTTKKLLSVLREELY